MKYKRSQQWYSIENTVLKNFAILTGMKLFWSLFLIKLHQLYLKTSASSCFEKYDFFYSVVGNKAFFCNTESKILQKVDKVFMQ